MDNRDQDLKDGRQAVLSLIDVSANPPIVRREIKSVGRLHAELRLIGFRLIKKLESHRVEGGYQLFYAKEMC